MKYMKCDYCCQESSKIKEYNFFVSKELNIKSDVFDLDGEGTLGGMTEDISKELASGFICSKCIWTKRKNRAKYIIIPVVIILIIIVFVIVRYDDLSALDVFWFLWPASFIFLFALGMFLRAFATSKKEMGGLIAIDSNSIFYRYLGFSYFYAKVEKARPETLGDIGIIGLLFNSIIYGIPKYIQNLRQKNNEKIFDSVNKKNCPKCKSKIEIVNNAETLEKYNSLIFRFNKPGLDEKNYEIEILHCSKCNKNYKRLKWEN